MSSISFLTSARHFLMFLISRVEKKNWRIKCGSLNLYARISWENVRAISDGPKIDRPRERKYTSKGGGIPHPKRERKKKRSTVQCNNL